MAHYAPKTKFSFTTPNEVREFVAKTNYTPKTKFSFLSLDEAREIVVKTGCLHLFQCICRNRSYDEDWLNGRFPLEEFRIGHTVGIGGVHYSSTQHNDESPLVTSLLEIATAAGVDSSDNVARSDFIFAVICFCSKSDCVVNYVKEADLHRFSDPIE